MGGRSTLTFFLIEKKCPNFGKKCPDCDCLWVKFFIYNEFLRVFRRKSRRFFPVGPFLLALQMIIYQCALISKKSPCPKKFLIMPLLTLLSTTCVKIHEIIYDIFETINHFSRHNFSEFFQLTHYIHFTKVSHQSANFKTFH